MKTCILAVCLFGLALAAPGGGRGNGEGRKGGPRGPIGGLVRLCISMAAEAEDKRDFDFESALIDICAFILSQKPEEVGDSSDDDDDDDETTEAPTVAPTVGSTDAPTVGSTDDPTGGPTLSTDSPGDINIMRRAKGRPGRDSGDEDDEEKDIVDVLLHICRGLAQMAEKADVEARAIETKEDLMEAMAVVCDAAKAEADAREATTPAK